MTQADVASDGDLLFGEPWLWKETASTLNPKPSTLMKPQKTRLVLVSMGASAAEEPSTKAKP